MPAFLSAPTSTILAQQIWQAGAGLVTLALVAASLSLEEQGYHYTLLSLAALATLMDFGLSQVLVQRAARLLMVVRWQDGAVQGPSADAFIALAGWGLRVYAMLGVVFVVFLLPAGFLFLQIAGDASFRWWPVLAVLLAVTALGLVPQPLLFLIEGSGQVARIYALRLVQGIAGSVTGWVVLVAGGGLWAAVAAPLAAVLVPLIALFRFAPAFTKQAMAARHGAIAWRRDLWPLQWRVGIGLVSGYLLGQIATPILFAAEGPQAAGQMGLSLALCNMIGLMARARLIGHVPAMTQAALNADWAELRRIYRTDFIWLLLLFGAGIMGFLVIAPWLDATPLAARILPLPVFLMVLAAIFAATVQTLLAAQLRAFGVEPLALVNVGGAVLTMLGMAWAAPRFGSLGVAGAMLGVQLFAVLPISFFLWRRFHRLHHHG